MPSINVQLTKDEFKELKRCKPEGMTWKQYLFKARLIMVKLDNKPLQDVEFPCLTCDYCPYGQIVEMFPFSNVNGTRGYPSCHVFGHDCPATRLMKKLKQVNDEKNDDSEMET